VNFPSVEECLASTGEMRDLLYELDDLVRRGLVAVQRQARNHNLDPEEIDNACVTVLMTLVASVAVAANRGTGERAFDGFSALARDAFAWASRRSAAFAAPGPR
jgi:hypothetical protein